LKEKAQGPRFEIRAGTPRRRMPAYNAALPIKQKCRGSACLFQSPIRGIFRLNNQPFKEDHPGSSLTFSNVPRVLEKGDSSILCNQTASITGQHIILGSAYDHLGPPGSFS